MQSSSQPLPVYGEFSSLVLVPRGKACERGLAGKSHRHLKIGALVKESLAAATRSSAIGTLINDTLSSGAQAAGDLVKKGSTAGDILNDALSASASAARHTSPADLADPASASTVQIPLCAESLATAQDLTDGSLADSSLTEPALTTPTSLSSLVISQAWSNPPFLTCRKAGSPGAFCSPFTTIPSINEAADNSVASSPITNHMKSLERQLCPVRPSRRAEAAVFGRRSKRALRRKDFSALHRSLTTGMLQGCLRAGVTMQTCDKAID